MKKTPFIIGLIIGVLLIGLLTSCEKNFDTTFESKPKAEVSVHSFDQDYQTKTGYFKDGEFHYIVHPFEFVDVNSTNIPDTTFIVSSGEQIIVQQKITYVEINKSLYQIENFVDYTLTEITYTIHNKSNFTIKSYDIIFKITFSDGTTDEYQTDGADVKYKKTVDVITYYEPKQNLKSSKRIVDVEISDYYIY